MSRWITLHKTSPSGTVLFMCRVCGRQSPVPEARCVEKVDNVGDHIHLSCELLDEMRSAVEELHADTPTTVQVDVGLASHDTVSVRWTDNLGHRWMGHIHLGKLGSVEYYKLLGKEEQWQEDRLALNKPTG